MNYDQKGIEISRACSAPLASAQLDEMDDLDDGIEDAIGEFEGANDTEILHSPAFY